MSLICGAMQLLRLVVTYGCTTTSAEQLCRVCCGAAGKQWREVPWLTHGGWTDMGGLAVRTRSLLAVVVLVGACCTTAAMRDPPRATASVGASGFPGLPKELLPPPPLSSDVQAGLNPFAKLLSRELGVDLSGVTLGLTPDPASVTSPTVAALFARRKLTRHSEVSGL